MAECARSAVILDGEISKYVDILQGVAQGCTLSPNLLFKGDINDMMVAIEAAKQGVTMGEDTVLGLMFADDFVGISETPEGLQKQITRIPFFFFFAVTMMVIELDPIVPGGKP